MKIKIPIITKLLDKNAKNKLRVINKGRRQLKSENKQGLFIKLSNTLARVKLGKADSLNALSGRINFDIDLSMRQYLILNILSLSFNKSVLYSVGSNKALSHPLPREWRKALSEQGVRVNNFRSALLWRVHGLLFFGRGFFRGLQSIYFLLMQSSDFKKYVYFDRLDKKCFSQNLNRHNIVNWYLQWKGRINGIDSICHSVNGSKDFQIETINLIQTDGLPKLKGIRLFQYVIFVIYASIYSFLRLFFDPIYGFFLEELLKFKRISLAADEDLARDYLFNNSNSIYRPFWTYIAEERGARVLFYFYSTNNEGFKTKKGYSVQSLWYLMSWPYYLVWDKYQADFVKRFDQDGSIIEVVGPIWFSSNNTDVDVPLNSVSVFDITPKRLSMYILLGLSFEYYTPNIANQFLSDIQVVLSQNNINMLHKVKRKNQSTDKRCKSKINQLIREPNYIGVDPSSDANQVIQKTNACISMPFTSTAIIAKQEGKSSVYYDPSGTIQKDDRAAHGIPILSGIDELRKWVESLSMKDHANN